MSVKMLLFMAAAGAGFMVVSRAQPPVPTSATTAADSLAIEDVSLGEKFQYSVGSATGKVVGGSIRKSVEETEASLLELKPAIKKAKGNDGVRARTTAQKIMYADSMALDNLYMGRPIKAMKQSMEAKSLLNVVRTNLKIGV